MKFSFVKNDKTTYWDEIVLSLITLVALAIGALLIVFRPSFWIITESISVGFGVIALLLVFMYTTINIIEQNKQMNVDIANGN